MSQLIFIRYVCLASSSSSAPTYRGRVLVEFFVERESADAKMFSQACNGCREDLIPPAGSYRLDFELLEGMHLLDGHSDYQVDITLGHTLTGGSEDREREKGGKCWVTVESDSKHLKGANKTCIPFLQKKSIMVHNLPYPRDRTAESDWYRHTDVGCIRCRCRVHR
jgi:hypothetical protein